MRRTRPAFGSGERRTSLGLELVDDGLDVLGPRPGGHQHGIRGVDDDDVFKSENRDEPTARRDHQAVRVAGAHEVRVAEHPGSLAHGWRQRGERLEVADVIPAEITGNDDHATGVGGRLGIFVLTNLALEAGSAIAWSMAILGNVGHTRVKASGSRASSRRRAANSG